MAEFIVGIALEVVGIVTGFEGGFLLLADIFVSNVQYEDG